MATRKSKSSKSKAKKPVRKRTAPARRAKPAASSRPTAPAKARQGTITHTELASEDPSATQSWCEKVLGWKFAEPTPTPAGPYLMWRFPNQTGGGIRANNPPETPGSIPYCEVVGIKATYSRALQAGATGMMPPAEIPGGMGWIAIVVAPGGVPIGFWAAS